MSRKGMPPSAFGCSMVNFMWGSIEFRYCSIVSQFPLGMMLKTSSTYLFQSFTGIGSSGPRAIFSKYSIYMLATTGEHGKPIAAPSSCLNSLLMMSKAVGTGMLVNKAETSKETNSSSPLIFTDLRWSLKLLLSLTNDGVIPVYLWRILVKNLANW